MRILYLADVRFPLERANGIQTFHTCHALAARGHQVTLFVRPDTAHPSRDPFVFYGLPPAPGLRVSRAPAVAAPTARRAIYVASALSKAAGSRAADAVFTRDLGIAAMLTRLPRGVRPPVVYEAHGFAPVVAGAMGDLLSDGRNATTSKQRRLAARERRVWTRAEGYVAITQALADEMTERFGARACLAVVPDGVRLPAIRPAPAAPGTAIVGYAGHLYPWKGVDGLLASLAELPGVRGLIVGGLEGEPDLERLQRRAAELCVNDRVEFTGRVAPFEVAGHLHRATVLVLPNTATHLSSHYTSPLKLFEYMAAARPIVASNLPSLREVLRDGDNALLVPAGDAPALANAVRRLLDDGALAARLADAAYRDVAAYSWAERASALERVIDAAVAERAAPPAAGRAR